MAFHSFIKRKFLLSLSFVLAMVLLITYIGNIFANVGMIKLSHALMDKRESISLNQISWRDVLKESSPGHEALKWFQLAIDQPWPSTSAWWGLGRAGLAIGDYESAATGMRLMLEKSTPMPLAYQDALLALSLNGEHQTVIAQYEKDIPELRTAVLSDTVALAYLEQAKSSLDARDEIGARSDLEKVIQLRPFDLYANAYLYRIAYNSHDIRVIATYSQTLTHFSGSAIHPADKRLLGYAIQAIPVLLEERVWDQDMVNRVVGNWIWLYPESSELELLAFSQANQRPDDANARFNLAELYQRKGKLQRAEASYNQVLNIAPEYSDAYLRLGTLCEQQIDQCTLAETLDWYIKYLVRHPDDLRAIRRISDLCEKETVADSIQMHCDFAVEIASAPDMIEAPAAARLKQLLHDRLDDQSTLSKLLGTSSNNIGFGPNVLENGDFEAAVQGQLQGWKLSDEIDQGLLYRSSAFVGGQDGIDTWSGSEALRLTGLWRERITGANAPGWSGVWAWDQSRQQVKSISSDSSQWHMISLMYRTASATDVAYLHLNGNALLKLPATNGAWRHYVAAYCGSSIDTTSLAPFIFLSVPGDQLWVDTASIYPVSFAAPVSKHCELSYVVL
jgi:tetratricopeptide (TPR) repeat protein